MKWKHREESVSLPNMGSPRRLPDICLNSPINTLHNHQARTHRAFFIAVCIA